MIRRRFILLAAVVTAITALASVTIPALATTKRGPATATPSELTLAQDGVAAETTAALTRDLGLTAAQVSTRLAMETWATRTEAKLRSDLGAEFGGAWITANANTLMVAVTDAAGANRVKAAGATPKLVTRTASDLANVKRVLDTAARPADTIRGWFVDVPNNTVTVRVAPDAISYARSFLANNGVDPATVRLEPTATQARPLFDLVGGDPYFIGGNARCSVGFPVVGGFVTAGHCGRRNSQTAGFNQVEQGTFTQSSFPGNDMALVQVNEDWTPTPVAGPGIQGGNRGRNNRVQVAGAQEAPVGAAVCRSGSTTGVRCGVIQAKNVSVNYPEGTVNGLTQTNVCAEGGDSGGPFFSVNQAQGVTSGGTGDCGRGIREAITFFQPVNEILQTFRATLITTRNGGDQPPAASQPPSNQQPPASQRPPRRNR